MCKKLFPPIYVILVLGLGSATAFGYTGQGQFSIPPGQPTIDGIISVGEWDAATWIDMDTIYTGTPVDLSQARWAAMWSPATNLVYVVITGTDTDHIFSSDFVLWNEHDDVEIHIDANNTDVTGYDSTQRYAQHYFIGPDGTGGKWSHILTQSADSAIPGGYAVTVNGNVITYEFALTPYTDLNLADPAGSPVRTLQAGDVIGLDMVMFTRQTSGDYGMLCENDQAGKWNDASKFLDHTLVGQRLAAYGESPDAGSTGVGPLPVLTWKPGMYSAGHDVYFGTDYNDVDDANNSDLTGTYRGRQSLDANSYDTNDYDANGLFPGKTYFWRIDEVNDACQPQPWKGPVWGFAVECDMAVEGQLDMNDLKAFTLQWLAESSLTAPTTWCCGADMDHSGGVDFLDYALFAGQWALEAAQQGSTFYVDPVSGSMSNDGSYFHPWSTLQEVFANNKIESRDRNLNPINVGAPVQPGDTIMLRSGNHGFISIDTGYHNIAPVTIQAQPGHTPVLTDFVFRYVSNWVIKGITIAAGAGSGGYMFDVRSYDNGIASHDITLEDCYLYTVEDSSSWGLTEWNAVHSGIMMEASSSTVRNCTILNVDMGILVSGNSQVIGCTIQNFAKDGIRGGGSNILLEDNVILDSYAVNDNHDDGIQWYSGPSASVSNVVIRGNIVMNDTSGGTRSYISYMQGICSFDDTISNWVVENNVVVNAHYHGLSLYNATNCTLANNTAYNPAYIAGENEINTWIGFFGTSGGGNKLVNNLMHSATSGYNQQVTRANYTSYFVNTDRSNLDLHLKAGSPAIDAGTSDSAPSDDLDDVPRPQGAGYDVGAYEYVTGD